MSGRLSLSRMRLFSSGPPELVVLAFRVAVASIPFIDNFNHSIRGRI